MPLDLLRSVSGYVRLMVWVEIRDVKANDSQCGLLRAWVAGVSELPIPQTNKLHQHTERYQSDRSFTAMNAFLTGNM